MIARLDREPAFHLFTEGMGRWWPLDAYSRAVSELAHENVKAVGLGVQPRLGGSINEHLDDGRTLPWGSITDWRPPERVVIEWRPHSQPEPPTEIEVTFATHVDGTLVEIEHRGWDRLSESFCDALRPVYERGWPTTLARYVAAAAADARADPPS